MEFDQLYKRAIKLCRNEKSLIACTREGQGRVYAQRQQADNMQ